MTGDSRVSRRGLLLGLLAGAGGTAAFVGLRPWRAVVAFMPQTAESRLVRLFSHRESARAVGRAYLRTVDHAVSSKGLVDAIADGLPGGRVTLGRADDDELRRALAATITADFEGGRMVDVAGWMLSATEAHLYALAAIS